MTASTQPFQYPSAELLTGGIRLVRLHPAKASQKSIECDLIVSHLDSRPKYEALSYEWGTRVLGPYTILVNGEKFDVQRNLWVALHHLRLKSEIRTLWIDAICINQVNVEERNHQVEQMGKVYNQAERVVSWIGHGLNEHLLRYASIAVDFLGERSSRTLRLQSKPIPTEKSWEALLELCRQSYWNRLWIVQEVVLGKDVLVQSGDLTLPWKFLAQVCDLQASAELATTPALKYILSQFQETVPARLNRQRLELRQQKSPPVQGRALVDLLENFKEAECVDVRDRVFGLLGLAPSCCQHGVPVNYAASTLEIWASIIKHHHSHHREDAILAIRISHLIHDVLEVSAKDFPWLDKFVATANPDYVEVPGVFCGAISWLGLPFKDISWNTTWGIENREVQKLKCLSDQNSYIEKLLHIWPGRNLEDFSASQLKLTLSINGKSYLHGTDPETRPLNSVPQVLSNEEHSFILNDKKYSRQRAWLESLWRTSYDRMEWTSRQVRTRTHLGVLVTDTGWLCYAPSYAKAGDLLYKVQDCNIFIVVRSEGPHYNIIGRACLFDNDLEGMAAEFCDNYLHLDMSTWLLLCLK